MHIHFNFLWVSFFSFVCCYCFLSFTFHPLVKEVFYYTLIWFKRQSSFDFVIYVLCAISTSTLKYFLCFNITEISLLFQCVKWIESFRKPICLMNVSSKSFVDWEQQASLAYILIRCSYNFMTHWTHLKWVNTTLRGKFDNGTYTVHQCTWSHSFLSNR